MRKPDRPATTMLRVFLSVALLLVAFVAPPGLTKAVSAEAVISTGPNHSCAVDTDGTLWCWGYAAGVLRGYLGDGTTNGSSTPVQVGTDVDWSVVSAGSNHSCAIKTNGTLYCWGSNFRGQLGLGTVDEVFGLGQDSPVQVGTDTDWRSVSASSLNTCAIKTDDSLYCWGYNADGEVGDGTQVLRSLPTLVGGPYRAVSVGSRHSCAITTGNELRCWGMNFAGAVGDGSRVDRLVPTTVGSDTDWSQASAGGNYTCASKTNGTVWCWGANSFGEIGSLESIGATPPGMTVPSRVGTDTDWVAVGAGEWQSCATKSDGSLYCWGQNKKGELGGGGPDSDPHPTPVIFVSVPDPAPVEPEPVTEDTSTLFRFLNFTTSIANATDDSTWSEVRVSAHACATTSDDRIYCWGDNSKGALGQGNLTSSKAPLQVALGALAAPTIATDPVVSEPQPEAGYALSGTAGTWYAAPIPTFTYQWYRCTRDGGAVTSTRVPSGCAVIGSARALTYTPTTSDIGKRLRIAVKAENSQGKLTRYSAASAVVVSLPVLSKAPTVSGTTTVGKKLTAKPGTWSGTTPISYAYQWYACTSKVAASATLSGTCTAIPLATSSTFTLAASQRTKYVMVRVTATNSVDTAVHYSAATNAVR